MALTYNHQQPQPRYIKFEVNDYVLSTTDNVFGKIKSLGKSYHTITNVSNGEIKSYPERTLTKVPIHQIKSFFS